DQAGLDTFRKEYGNQLYTLEDRPGSDNAKYYGAKDVIDTEDLFEEIEKHSSHRADQRAFVKARIFDLLIGDWDRHEDQWEWAVQEKDGKVVYKPLPKDRDQALSSYDGLLIRMGSKMAKAEMLQSFGETIRDVQGFTSFYRPTDMPLTNEMPLETWKAAARELQARISDSVIERATRQMPAEVYAVSGADLAAKLRSRRDQLETLATQFYLSLAKETAVKGTKGNELLEVQGTGDGNIQLRLYSIDKEGRSSAQPFYSRLFKPTETKEIHVYGWGGNDQFKAAGAGNSPIIVRFIGGSEQDDYQIADGFGSRVHIYDNSDNSFSGAAKRHISNDTAVHAYEKHYKTDDFSIAPQIGYNNDDRVFVGLGAKYTNHGFRADPFISQNKVRVRYSIDQQAFSFGYEGLFRELIGKWHLGLSAEYDGVRDQDFPGIGNNTELAENYPRRYYRYRNKEINGALRLIRNIGKHHTVTASGLYQSVQVLEDTGRFISVHLPANGHSFTPQQFAGARLEYDYSSVDDPVVPKKGLRFNTAAEYLANTKNKNSVRRLNGMFGFIIPVGPFTLASRAGASTLSGEPEFYQLNKIGGGRTLRGFLRYRFYGNTAFYNQNELQWNFNVKTYLFNGKMGLVALFDNGRVWYPGEISDTWHTAVGGGLMLAPFNKISVTGTYAVSKDGGRISVRFGHMLK
ncbi:MAG TPA: BamA/TamA family outer membrane protein, partial [Chitinophagaceae bacterium]